MSDDPKIEIRAASAAPAIADGARPRITGHFARFGGPGNEIDSAVEGRFLERIEPGAFARTLKNNGASIRMIFQHGRDPEIGDKPIGAPDVLREDAFGPYFEGDLFDSVPALVVDGLRAGQYGISYRFSVLDEEWDHSGKRSDVNPSGLPVRTIRQARVYEFGPVTYPADPGADYSVRAITLADLEAPTAPEPEPAPAPEPAATHLGEAREAAPTIASTPEEITPVEYRTRDEKAARLSELKDVIARTATEYPGVMPEAVQSEWDLNNKEHDELVRDIAAWDARMARVAQIATEAPAISTAPYSAPTIVRKAENIYDLGEIRATTRSREEYDGKVRDNAMRSLETTRLAKGANLDNIERAIDDKFCVDQNGTGEIARRVLLTGSPVYQRAFNKYLKGETALWTPEEARAAALAVTGTTTTGGYSVPYQMDPTMIHIGAHTAINPYRSACRVETITGGNNWLAVTVGVIAAAYGAEASAAVEGGPTFGQPTFTVQTAKAFATVSHETLQDRSDVVEELSSLFGEAKDTLEENEFTLGTGATVYPFGMFRTAAFTNQDTATNDTTAITDLRLLESVIPLRHRMNTAFFMSRSTQRQLEALDTTGYYFKRPGQYFAAGSAIPQNMATGNTGTQVLGYPIWEVPSAVSTLTTDGAIIVVAGDTRNYVIVDRLGMSVEVIQNMTDGATPSFPTMQRGVLCYWRNTARPINADGMRSLSVQ
jgi:HK97 family phage major capsid protein/HK97 family phage prohead protease